MTQPIPFNPYYAPPQAYATSPMASSSNSFKSPGQQNGFNAFNKINSGMQIAGMAAGDTSELFKSGPKSNYISSGNHDYKPGYDYQGERSQANALDQSAKSGAFNIAGDAAKYASAGAAFGPVGAAIGGIAGAGMGIAKYIKGENDANKYRASVQKSLGKYNNDLDMYNQHQSINDVNNAASQQYATRSPYQIPASAYWY